MDELLRLRVASPGEKKKGPSGESSRRKVVWRELFWRQISKYLVKYLIFLTRV